MDIPKDEIAKLFAVIEVGLDNNAYLAADNLAQIGGQEIIDQLIPLLSSPNYNTAFLAARALSKCNDNGVALEIVLELLKTGTESFQKGILTEALAGFDCSEHFIEVFKLYLFGTLKVSAMAKDVLDEQEFAITPRIIRKAKKHWNHYQHNIKSGDDFIGKKSEIEAMFATMEELFMGEDLTEEELPE